jgi:hypothetical protein
MTRDEVLAQLEAWSSSQSRIVDPALRSQQAKAIMARLDAHRVARVIDPDAEPKKRSRK